MLIVSTETYCDKKKLFVQLDSFHRHADTKWGLGSPREKWHVSVCCGCLLNTSEKKEGQNIGYQACECQVGTFLCSEKQSTYLPLCMMCTPVFVLPCTCRFCCGCGWYVFPDTQYTLVHKVRRKSDGTDGLAKVRRCQRNWVGLRSPIS